MSKSNLKDIILHEHDTWTHFEDSSEKIFRTQLNDEDIAVLEELADKYGIKYSFDKNNSLTNLGDINLWVDSNAYNFVENIHQIWLLTIADLLIGSREYSA